MSIKLKQRFSLVLYVSKDLILLFLIITSTVDMTGMMNLGMFVEELFV